MLAGRTPPRASRGERGRRSQLPSEVHEVVTPSRGVLFGCLGLLLLAAGLSAACSPSPTTTRDLAIQASAVPSGNGHTATYSLFVSGQDRQPDPHGNTHYPGSTYTVLWKCPVTITETLPPGTAIVGGYSYGWIRTPTGFLLNDCPPGYGNEFSTTQGLLSPVVIVSVPHQGAYTYCVTLSNGTNAGLWAESSLTNNTTCATANVPPPLPLYNMTIQKQGVVSADGQTVTYNIDVSGTIAGSPGLLINCPLTVNDLLPPNATFVSSSASISSSYGLTLNAWTRAGSTYSWSPWLCSFAGTFMLPGPVSLSFTVVASVPPGQVVTNCATVFSNYEAIEDSLSNNTVCTTNTMPAGALSVDAVLDGLPWAGALSFNLVGPQALSGVAVPDSGPTVTIGAYSLVYVSGGPVGATLLGITPAATQTVPAGGAASFTFNFRSNKSDSGFIRVAATLDGVPWSGPLSYSVSGQVSSAGTSVPQTSAPVPGGSYTVTYTSGGPTGATLSGISSAPTQTVAVGGTTSFTLNFRSDEGDTGVIPVDPTVRPGPR